MFYLRRKGSFKKKKFIILLTALVVLTNSISVYANTSIGCKYIDKKHGYLTGEVSCFWFGSPLNEKIANASAETKANVSKIRATLTVNYYNSGVEIDKETSHWLKNRKAAYTPDYEAHHTKNRETGKYDGLKNTKIVAYGAADAIQEKAYVVYTKVIK